MTQVGVSGLVHKDKFIFADRRSCYQGGAVERVCVFISGRMRVRSPEGAGWYDLELLRIYIEEGADSEEEQWVTASETESDTDESDTDESEDGQGD